MTLDDAAKHIIFGTEAWMLVNKDRPIWVTAHAQSFIVGQTKKILKQCEMFPTYRSLDFIKGKYLYLRLSVKTIEALSYKDDSIHAINQLNRAFKNRIEVGGFEHSADYLHALACYRMNHPELITIEEGTLRKEVLPKPPRALIDLSSIVNFKFS